MRDIADLVDRGGTGKETDGGSAVDLQAGAVFGDEICVAVGLHVAGDTGECLVPGNAFPRIGAGFAHLRIVEPVNPAAQILQNCRLVTCMVFSLWIGITMRLSMIFQDVRGDAHPLLTAYHEILNVIGLSEENHPCTFNFLIRL